MTHYSRAEWHARPPRGRTPLERHEVEGIALHWPGITVPLGNPARVMSALRSWQALHMDTNQIAAGGASDIAYQVAVDQLGNTYKLRGLRIRSGANGNTDLNDRFGAILLVLAEGEKPTPQLIDAVKRRIARHRQLFPHSKRIVGHGQIRPGGTLCPGPRVQRLINAGAFDPTGGIR